jgi:chromosome segregation ATPase
MFWKTTATLLLCGAFAVATTTLWAGTSPSKNKSKTPSAVSKAKNELNGAQQRFAASVARVRASTARLQQLHRAAPLKYKEVAAQHDSTPSLEGSRATLEQEKKEFDEASRSLIEELRQTPEYRQAVAERDALKAKLKNLPMTSSYDRKDAEHQLALAYQKVKKLEKDALQADPDASSLMEAVRESEETLQELDKQRDAEMANDPALAQLRQSIAQARMELANARVAAAAEAHKLAAARQQYEHQMAAELAKHQKDQKKKHPPKHKKR